MGHDKSWKFNTKVLNFYGFGFPKKSKITEGCEEMFTWKSISEKISDFRVKVLIFQEFEFLENLMDIERKHKVLYWVGNILSTHVVLMTYKKHSTFHSADSIGNRMPLNQ